MNHRGLLARKALEKGAMVFFREVKQILIESAIMAKICSELQNGTALDSLFREVEERYGVECRNRIAKKISSAKEWPK